MKLSLDKVKIRLWHKNCEILRIDLIEVVGEGPFPLRYCVFIILFVGDQVRSWAHVFDVWNKKNEAYQQIPFFRRDSNPLHSITFNFFLNSHEALFDFIECLSKSSFYLIEFLSDQAQPSQQIVQIGVNFLHPASN